MIAILICDCGCTDFEYTGSQFICTECGSEYDEEIAGKHLMLVDNEEETNHE